MSNVRVDAINQINQTNVVSFKEKINSGEFSFELRRITTDGLAERLEVLINDITTWGTKIAEHPEIRELKHYRNLITQFINEVVTNSHEFSRENFLDRRGRHRVYGIVRVVNKELDDLAQELLKNEKDHIKILDITDQIRGLLLDILV